MLSLGRSRPSSSALKPNVTKHHQLIYNKVIEQHPAVESAVFFSSKTALGAAVTGIVIDAASADTTGGANSAMAAQMAMAFTIAKNAVQFGHVVTSCVQRAWLKQCLKDMRCSEESG